MAAAAVHAESSALPAISLEKADADPAIVSTKGLVCAGRAIAALSSLVRELIGFGIAPFSGRARGSPSKQLLTWRIMSFSNH